MKSIITLTFFLFAAISVNGQSPCTKPQAVGFLDANHIKAAILTGGDLFNNGTDLGGEFRYLPDPAQPSTLLNASLWIMGVDEGGNLRVSASTYRYHYTDFAPGPLSPENGQPYPDACADWDRIFKVSLASVEAFKTTGATLTLEQKIAQFPDIMSWPGRQNPWFSDVYGFDLPNTAQDMAPFFDVNNDGNYDPQQGDLPAVILNGKAPFLPTQLIWCVMNDVDSYDPENNGTQPVQMEVQLTAWAFDCPEKPELSDAVFTSHKLIYRGTENLEPASIGLFTDFDLGCYADDFTGSAPEINTWYAYNQDAVDGMGGGFCAGEANAAFVNTPPVQSVTMLNRPLEHFLPFGSFSAPEEINIPEISIEFYYTLTGSWREGTPLTYGGNGYNPGSSNLAGFAFPDDPSSVSGWSMCTTNLPLDDVRTLGSTSLADVLVPGAVNELVTAWSITPDPDLPCSTGKMKEHVGLLQSNYDEGFAACNALLSPTTSPEPEPLGIAPNPASGSFSVQSGSMSVERLQIVAVDGRVVKTLHNVTGNQSFSIDGLDAGTYFVQAFGENSVRVARLVVLR